MLAHLWSSTWTRLRTATWTHLSARLHPAKPTCQRTATQKHLRTATLTVPGHAEHASANGRADMSAQGGTDTVSYRSYNIENK